MKPKLNKLITLLLLLSTFAFLSAAEEKVTAFAKKELSEWASWLPDSEGEKKTDSLNPYSKSANLLDLAHSFLKKSSGKKTENTGISFRPF